MSCLPGCYGYHSWKLGWKDTDPPPPPPSLPPPPPPPALSLKTFYPWALLESWESSSKLKFEQTRRWAASSPRLSSATLEGGWADYDCKLIFIHVRAAHFNFQHVISGCAPEVAAVPAELSATLTSGGLWTSANAAVRPAEPDFKDVTRDVFHLSGAKRRNGIRRLPRCIYTNNRDPPGYAERQELIFLFTELRFKPRQADAQARHH